MGEKRLKRKVAITVSMIEITQEQQADGTWREVDRQENPGACHMLPVKPGVTSHEFPRFLQVMRTAIAERLANLLE